MMLSHISFKQVEKSNQFNVAIKHFCGYGAVEEKLLIFEIIVAQKL